MASPGVTTLRVAGLAGLALTVAAGSAGLVAGFFEQTARRTTQVAGAVTALDVTSGAGDVTVSVLPAGGPARVTAVRHWSFSEPTPTQTLDGGTLRLRPGCGGVPFADCSVDWDVAVPAGTRVTVVAGSGDVVLSGAAGDVDVRTGSGDVSLADGRAPSVAVTTGTGDVRLRFVAVPDAVAATTGTGDVTVRLPAGPSYRVLGRTGAGTRQVDVLQDPASGHVVRVDTGAGDVTVSPTG